MKLSTVLTASLMFLLPAPSIGQDGKSIAQVPVYKVGEQWHFDVEFKLPNRNPNSLIARVERVERANDKEVWILRTTRDGQRTWLLIDPLTGGLKNEFGFDENSANQVGPMRREYLPAAAVAQFPLEVGKSYPVVQKFVAPQGTSGTTDLKAKVAALEKIKFDSGEIDAFRIELTGSWFSGGGGGKLEDIVWYAPSIKQFVKREHKDFYSGFIENHRITSVVQFKPAP